MMKTADLLAAVDGGATGTRVRLHDASGALLGQAEAGPSSLTLGVDQAWENVGGAIRAAVAAAGLPDPCGRLRIGAALAGSRNPGRRSEFRAGDPFCAEIVIVTDGYASLLGALSGRPGTVLAIGTGSAGHRLMPDGSVRETSGWGFPAGDEGSGSWMGHRAMQAYLKHLDGRLAADSVLFPAIEARVGADIVGLQNWLLAARATQYATLAPLVLDAAKVGDTIAGSILETAVAEVVLMLEALEPEGSTDPLSLLGGLAPTLAPLLPEAANARLVPAEGNALDGVLRVLRGQSPPEALP